MICKMEGMILKMVLEETKFLMKKYNIKANKSLGQNFLIDDDVIDKIVDGAEVEKDDIVIEIGPGLGSMTKILLERARKVICIELDPKMIKILHDRFIAYSNIEIINEDVLKIDLNKLIEDELLNEKNIRDVKIVANLPYYITTPIIMKLIESNLKIESITVMIQKEVADRLIEIPSGKNTGAITYTVYYYCDSENIGIVDNTSFIPMPEVTSEIIRLKLRKEPKVQVEDEKLFFKIIKCAFMQRRKTLLNSLNNAGIFKDKKHAEKVLTEIGLAQDIRPENLSIEDYANLSDYISNNSNFNC